MTRSVPACPHCATPEEQPLTCDRCGWRWYANPKPAAAVLLERTNGDALEVLLLRRAVQPGFGAWDLPAGYLDPGESFEAGARREAAEEAGIAIELDELTGVYHSAAANAVTAVFRAHAIDADASVQTDSESSDHAWVPHAEVPSWLPRMAFTSMAAALADWANTAIERGRVGA